MTHANIWLSTTVILLLLLLYNNGYKQMVFNAPSTANQCFRGMRDELVGQLFGVERVNQWSRICCR